MNKKEIIKKIENPGIIPVIRLRNSNKIFPLLEALIEGGITCAELTTTIPDAFNLMAECKKRYAETIILGMGTIFNGKQADAAISAGAEFLVSPLLAFDALKVSQRHKVPFMMGAFSPSEIYQAQQSGSDYVKIFPISKLGIKYIKDIKGPMPDVKVVPTGGITYEDMEELVKCKVAAIGIGGELLVPEAVSEDNWGLISNNAAKFVNSIRKMKSRQETMA